MAKNVTSASAHPYLNVVAAGSGDGSVLILEDDQPPIQLEGHASEVVLLKWIALGRGLAIGDTTGRV